MSEEKEMIRKANRLAEVIRIYNKADCSLWCACERAGVHLSEFLHDYLGARVVWVTGEEGAYAIGLCEETSEPPNSELRRKYPKTGV